MSRSEKDKEFILANIVIWTNREVNSYNTERETSHRVKNTKYMITAFGQSNKLASRIISNKNKRLMKITVMIIKTMEIGVINFFVCSQSYGKKIK